MHSRPVFSFQQISIEPIRRGPSTSYTRRLRAWQWRLDGEFLPFLASLPSWYCPEIQTAPSTPPRGLYRVLFAWHHGNPQVAASLLPFSISLAALIHPESRPKLLVLHLQKC